MVVVSGRKFWSCVHGGAEAGIGECGALHCDDEQIAAPKLIIWIAVLVIDKDTVLDGDCGEFAGASTEESERFGWRVTGYGG